MNLQEGCPLKQPLFPIFSILFFRVWRFRIRGGALKSQPCTQQGIAVQLQKGREADYAGIGRSTFRAFLDSWEGLTYA